MAAPQGPVVWTRAAVGWIVAAAVCVALVGLTVLAVATTHDAPRRAAPSATSSTTTTTTSTTTTSTTTTTTTTVAAPATVPVAGGASPPVFSRLTTTDPVVFFTIDDGLVRDPAVVDFIRDHHIPVTLFPVVSAVNADPAYFESIRALGATVQDHTVHHANLTTLGLAAQQNDICAAADSFASQYGQRPWLLRPPYGAYNANTLAAARACGMRAIIMWRATMNNGVLATQGGPLQPGDIILMHFRTDLRQNLEVALNAATARGLHPAPLESYIPPA
jgi:peptidoglycan/xylan/chitin deacetylase (PgdA/CDA1 family)